MRRQRRTFIKNGRFNRLNRALATVSLAIAVTGCGLNSAKKQYVFAETLWNEGNYAAAVSEFEKVHSRDPKGTLGLQALFRAATTEAFFLNQNRDAIKKFRQYSDVSADPETAWEAKLQIGEILFMKLEQYDEAIQLYRELLKQRPKDADAGLFQFRIGKSQFFLRKFNESIDTWQSLLVKYPTSPWAERAMFEIGVAHYTRGEHSIDAHSAGPTVNQSYHDAMKAYERFIKKYPKSTLVTQARFGIASCLEELDDLDGAYHAYEALKSVYPSPNVITVKLVRIRERKAQKNR